MPTPEEFVEQIAALADTRGPGERVAEGVDLLDDIDTLDPTLFADNALTYFRYDGPEDRKLQFDFLRSERTMLERRYGEIEQLGHATSGLSIVKIHKLLTQLDLMLDTSIVRTLREWIAGDMKGLVAADGLTNIASTFLETTTAMQAVSDAVLANNYRGISDKLDEVDRLTRELADAVQKIGHSALRSHLHQIFVLPGLRFGSGTTCQAAREAIQNTVTEDLRKAWNTAKSQAESAFGEVTAARGKRLKLSSAVKFDQDLGPALKKWEQAKSKNEDAAPHRDSAVTGIKQYLRQLDRLPDALKTATPDFVGPLRATLLGLMASVQAG